jgi:hypothetical protein
MAKYIQRKDGTMAGSIGDGKDKIPTVSMVAPSVASTQPGDVSQSVDDTYARFQANATIVESAPEAAPEWTRFQREASKYMVIVEENRLTYRGAPFTKCRIEDSRQGNAPAYMYANITQWKEDGEFITEYAWGGYRSRTYGAGPSRREIGRYATRDEALAAAKDVYLSQRSSELELDDAVCKIADGSMTSNPAGNVWNTPMVMYDLEGNPGLLMTLRTVSSDYRQNGKERRDAEIYKTSSGYTVSTTAMYRVPEGTERALTRTAPTLKAALAWLQTIQD